jgi:hypothetical protein
MPDVGDSQWRRKVFDSPGLTQAPPGPHLAELARRWNGLPGQPESPDPKDINLTGVWLADGYECYDSTLGRRVRLPTKRVSVSHVGEDLAAVKIDGDLCVPAGHVTFRGRLPRDSRRAIVTWAVGTPERPASGTVRGTLKIIDRDHFRTDDSPTGEVISFVRAGHSEEDESVRDRRSPSDLR